MGDAPGHSINLFYDCSVLQGLGKLLWFSGCICAQALDLFVVLRVFIARSLGYHKEMLFDRDYDMRAPLLQGPWKLLCFSGCVCQDALDVFPALRALVGRSPELSICRYRKGFNVFRFSTSDYMVLSAQSAQPPASCGGLRSALCK